MVRMHLLTKDGAKLELTPLETTVTESKRTHAMRLEVATDIRRDAVSSGALIARAARGFFELGRDTGKMARAAAPVGPPPTTFRDESSGALRVVYREIVVRFGSKVSLAKRKAILRERGFAIRRGNPYVSNQFVVYQPERNFSGEQLLEIANEWTTRDEVLFATPNFVSQFWRLSSAPKMNRHQWHLRNPGTGGARKGEDVDAAGAWKMTRGKKSIVVAVLDDGVDIEHPNLKSRIWRNPSKNAPDRNGRDFFLPEDDPGSNNPRPKLFQFPFDQMTGNDIHGTPCAGVIGAPGSNGGAIGIAPGCRVLPIKVFHGDNLAADERVANAIRYAARHAQILSCSWSGGFSSDLQQALEDIATEGRGGLGALAFFAAGNEDHDPVGYPARDPNAIAVGASTDTGELASYSNVGKQIAFVAPSSGGIRGVFTTDVSLPNRGFNTGKAKAGGVDGLHTNDFGGTSSATPLAAGVAALILSVRPDLSATQVRQVMQQSCDKIGDGYDANGHSDNFGFGRINAAAAVKAAQAL
jgi:subtilisin family serine protease